MNEILRAKHFSALRSGLRSIDVDVPAHPKDRLNGQVEIYTLVSLLGAIPWALTDFPVVIQKRERPDFALTLGGVTVGIEHTEAIPQNDGKARALRADGHGDGPYFVKPASVGDPVKSQKEVLADVVANRPGDGWVGNSAEVSWAEAIAHFIAKKAASASKPGYERYDRNWLMIYDSWPAPAVKHHVALPLLRDDLSARPPWDIFDRIYVVDEHTIVELTMADTRIWAGRH